MTEKVGGIEYTIDVNTSKVTSSSNAVQASTQKMEDSFAKVDAAVSKNTASFSSMSDSYSKSKKAVIDYIAEQVKAGRTIDENGNVITAYGVKAKKLTDDLRKLTGEFKNNRDEIQNVDNAFLAITKSEQKLEQATKESTFATQKKASELKKLKQQQDKVAASANNLSKAYSNSADGANKAASGAKNASRGLQDMSRKAGMAGVQIEQFVGQVQGGGDVMRAFSYQATDLGIVLGAPLVGAAVGLGAALLAALVPSFMDSGDAADELREKLLELKEVGKLEAVQAKSLAREKQKAQEESKKEIEELVNEIKANEELQKAREKRLKQKTGRGIGALGAIKKAYEETTVEIETQNSKLATLNTTYEDGNKELKEYQDIASGVKTQTEEQKKTIEGLIAALKEEEFALKNSARAVLESKLSKEGAAETDKLAALALFDSIALKKEEIEKDKESKKLAKEKAENIKSVLVAYQNQVAQLELNNKAQDEYNARRRLGLQDGEQIPANIQAEIDALELLRVKKAEIAEQAKAEKVIEQEFKTLSTGLESGGMTELEKIQADFEAKRALIQEHTAILMQDDELTAQQKAEAAKNAAGLITDIEENAATAREKIAESEQASKLKAVSSAFGSLSSLMNTESKKLFEIGKAAAIAGAIVDGYAAIQGAYKVGSKLGGPPVGAAFAAASAVQTAVQVQGIAKQKIGGAKTMGATSSFQGGVPTANTGGAGGFGDRNVTVAGLDPSSLFSGEQVRELLKNLAGDGADFTFLNGGG